MEIRNLLTVIMIFTFVHSYSQQKKDVKQKSEVENIEKGTANTPKEKEIEAQIELVYDKDKKQLKLNKENDDNEEPKFQRSLELKKGKIYQVFIKGLNTAVINSKIEFKPFVFSSKTPEIIKPIFIGITESGELESKSSTMDEGKDSDPDYNTIKYLKAIYKGALDNYTSLVFLKKKSDSLYNETIYSSENGIAKNMYKNVLEKFGVLKEADGDSLNYKLIKENDYLESLNNKIIEYQKYIESSKSLFYSYLEKLKQPNSDILEPYSQLVFLAEEMGKKDFRKYSNFIHKSQTSENKTKSIKFSPSKDGVDIDITLINTYVNDTLFKKPFSVYSSGGLSFDFTTGFFYSDLVERSYFLMGREGDTTRTNIIEEDTRDFDVSFGALGHVSYKFASSFKAGLSMGATLSPLDGKTRYLIGGSFIFGRKNQVALNVGMSLAKIKILSGSVDMDSEGLFVPASVTAIPTFEKIERGFYLGATYNLSVTKKR
ncbi:hypothetical protein [Maribacter aestuarii]|uniref:hypothetical protein n=1 Tax=Maribacter aestuarii TaxID=1130723 RepID=UPI00248D0160|nr:hypothetical protein [Maribacter aestuarii]